MFRRSDVNKVLKSLCTDVGYFVNEAHFQMSFAAKVMERYGKSFVLIPEYPIQSILNPGKVDNIDLLIIDSNNNNEKTFIEFKHKTTNTEKGSLKVTVKNANIQITPKPNSLNLGRFDCWSDIERLERYRGDPELGISNAFFILITNDSGYWKPVNNGKFGDKFSMDGNPSSPLKKTWKSWDDNRPKRNNPQSLGSVDYSELGAISEGRNRVIQINKQYTFDWHDFITVPNYISMLQPSERKQCGEYRRLIVEI